MADEVQGTRKVVEMGEGASFQEIVKANLHGWHLKAQTGLL